MATENFWVHLHIIINNVVTNVHVMIYWFGVLLFSSKKWVAYMVCQTPASRVSATVQWIIRSTLHLVWHAVLLCFLEYLSLMKSHTFLEPGIYSGSCLMILLINFLIMFLKLCCVVVMYVCKLLFVQVAWLDKIDRRYSWLKRALVKFDEDFHGTFPSEWHVEERISEEFCRITKYDIENVNFLLYTSALMYNILLYIFVLGTFLYTFWC